MTETTAPAKTHIHATGRERLLGHLAMFSFAALIAGSFSLGRLALPYVDPIPLNAARYLIGTVVMGVITFGLLGHKLRPPEASWRYVFLGGVMAFYFVSMFIALTMTSPVSTSAVFTLMPIMTAGFGYLLLRQKVRPLVALSLAFAATGSIWVIFRADIGAILSFDIGQGELIYFAGCIGHAAFAPLLRRWDRGEPGVVVSFYVIAFIGLWIGLVGAGDILATDWLALPPIAWLALFYLAVFSGTVTFFLMQFASMRLPASKVMAYGYLVPVFVILYEGLAGHGWTSLPVLAGALVTCLGLAVLYYSPDS